MTKLYEGQTHLLIHTGYCDPAEHRHGAVQMILSFDGKMKVVVGKEMYYCRGIAIPSGVRHRIVTNGKPSLVFLYDSTTNVARQIKEVQSILEADCDKIIAQYNAFEKIGTVESYNELEQGLLQCFGISKARCCVADARIVAAINYIRAMLSQKISCQEVATAVFLSPGRFSHLFKAQVGMTFSAYLLYQRIVCGYTAILQGKPITEAAFEAGFSSSSHFADVNHRVFGLSASAVTKDLQFQKIQ